MVRIIDSVVNLLTPEVVGAFPEVWFKQLSGAKEAVGLDSKRMFEGVPLEEIVSQLDQGEVQTAMLHAIDLGHWQIRIPVEAVAKSVSRYPDRLIAGAVGVDPYKGMESIRKLEAYVKDHGFRALHFFPHWLDRAPNDAIYYPFYSKCVELDIAVCIQIRMASQNFLRNLAKPDAIDEIAAYFPELRIVGLHAGLPWLEEFMALALKHPNFFITTSTYAPRDWDKKFVDFVNGKGQDKVIFGSGAPMVKGGIKGYLSGIQDLGLSEQTLNKYFEQNAKRVFKL
jgi:uncharacterized protein